MSTWIQACFAAGRAAADDEEDRLAVGPVDGLVGQSYLAADQGSGDQVVAAVQRLVQLQGSSGRFWLQAMVVMVGGRIGAGHRLQELGDEVVAANLQMAARPSSATLPFQDNAGSFHWMTFIDPPFLPQVT